MTYFNQFHKEKTERCLLKMRDWYKSPMTLSEQQEAVEQMKRNLAQAIEM